MWRTWLLMLALAATPWAARAEASLTANVTSVECWITSYGAAPGNQKVPCGSTATFTLGPDQGVSMMSTYSFHYRDNGGSFASGVSSDCTWSRPCVVDAAATHEYGVLHAVFTVCASGSDCRSSAYPLLAFITAGPDDSALTGSAIEILYPFQASGTVTMTFALESATFSAVTAVPEPSSWALLAFGLVALHFGSRRRRVV